MNANLFPRLCSDPVRTRLQIIRDYSAAHDLTPAQVDALVRQLPDYHELPAVHSPFSGAVERPNAEAPAVANVGHQSNIVPFAHRAGRRVAL